MIIGRIFSLSRGRIVKYYLIECDTCKALFRKQSCCYDAPQKERHFCSRVCVDAARRVNGTLYERSRVRSLENWGVEHPSQSEDIKARTQRTNVERYGAHCALWTPSIHKKVVQTWRENYGVDHPLCSSEVQAQAKRSLKKKYGVDNAYQISASREKARLTMLERYGAPTYMQSETFKVRVATSEFQARRHETLKRNGSYGKSKLEDRLFIELCSKFGDENVQRQVTINSRAIDFYVKSIDTYVQFDGAYWHGLSDSFLAESNEPKTKRECHIKYMWQLDREQDAWFKKQGLRLIRITDVEHKKMGTKVLERLAS